MFAKPNRGYKSLTGLVELVSHAFEVGHRTEQRIDRFVVRYVVTEIDLRRFKYWRQPNYADANTLEVRDFFCYT